MATTSLTHVKELAERAQRMEVARKRERLHNKLASEAVTGSITSVVAAAAAGYIDGKFDVSGTDTTAGDGLKVFDIPVMPIAGALLAIAGLSFRGQTAVHVRHAGVGILAGFAYSYSSRKGSEK